MLCRDPSAGSTEVPDLPAQCEEMEAVPVSLLHRSGVHLCPDSHSSRAIQTKSSWDFDNWGLVCPHAVSSVKHIVIVSFVESKREFTDHIKINTIKTLYSVLM